MSVVSGLFRGLRERVFVIPDLQPRKLLQLIKQVGLLDSDERTRYRLSDL